MLGYLLLALAAAVFIAAVLLLAVYRRRHAGETTSPEELEPEARPPEPEAAASVTADLARAADAPSVARTLLDEVVALLGVEFAAVAEISDDGQEATGLVARTDGEDVDWWRSVRIDLANEPSAIASAAFEATPLVIFDVESSPRVNRRLADRVGAKSAAFVPVISGSRVLAVVVAASTIRRRAFPPQDMARLEVLAGETALALERTRSAAQLEEALERERLVAAIGRRVRSEHDVEALLGIAVEEVGKAANVARCYIRLGEPGGPMPIRAEWDAPGVRPIGEAAPNLPVANLAVRKRRTVASGEVENDPELEDPTLGSVETLLGIGTKAVLATPIQVFDEVIGAFGLHRQQTTVWTASEIALAEAVAREVGLALHTARLLDENRRRLDRQAALVQAAQVMTSELQVETVLQRLVVEVTKLLEADAADCYLYDTRRGVLRCAAVYGLPAELLEFEFPAETALAGEAMRRRQAVVSGEYEIEVEGPHPAYEGFSGAMVAPMTWWGEVRGVIGVGTNDPDRRFSPEDVEVLEAFASLGSLALRNVASIEQSTRQVRIQRGFFRIASVLAQPLSLDETLNAVAQAATEALGGTAAAVLMPRERDLTLTGSYELPEAVAEFLREGLGGAEPLRDAALRKRVLASPQLIADDRFGDDWRKLVEAGFQSLVAVPIEAPRREQTGVGLVLFSEEQAFADDEIELAHHLAGAARGALERAELYEGERRNRAIAQQLARTGTLLASELDPDAILEEIVAQAPGLVGADAAAVSLLEGDELVVSAVHGDGTEAVLGSRVSAVGELAGEVVESRAPLAVGDAREDGLVSGSDALLEAGYAAYLGAPLLGAEGAVHGVLAVYAREPRTWREEEVEALGALAGNVSAFLSNAELYQRVVLERERSLAILGNVADGIVAVDREGAVVLWNAAAEEITGVSAPEAMGRTPADVLQRSFEPDETSAEGRGQIQVRRGEEEVWLSVSEAVMRDPAGTVAGRIYAFRDVSSDRLVEQLKTGFVSTVSHELRAPLTSIYGFAETLLREDVAFGAEERRTFLGYIASEAQRLTGIVDALLSVARLEAGDLQVQVAPTDLREVVSDVVETAVREGANGRQFVVDIPEEPLAASADRDKVRQILINLVDNAVKFSPDGGTVTVAARRTRDAVQVRVVDEGSGVPQSEQERIFRKFYRAEAPTPAPGGTGLGLFIARGLASAMGGRVWVDSNPGPGGCFVFELPSVATEPAETGV